MRAFVVLIVGIAVALAPAHTDAQSVTDLVESR